MPEYCGAKAAVRLTRSMVSSNADWNLDQYLCAGDCCSIEAGEVDDITMHG
jgi:hypothetical protein